MYLIANFSSELEFAFQIPKIWVNSEPYKPFYQKKRSFGSDRVMR